MQEAALSFQQIFNQLLAGKKMLLHFPNVTEAETFRVRMHHFKSRQERTLEAIGAKNEEERTVFSFMIKPNPEGGQDVAALAAFTEPKTMRRYTVVLLEDGDLEQAGKQNE